MKSIKTLKEARGLPEKDIIDYVEGVDEDGMRVMIPFFRGFGVVELEDDTILRFIDRDGRLMEINYDEEGAYKTPVSGLV